MPVTYSFAEVTCAIEGPGGRFSLSEGNVADEGISIEMTDDKSTMTTGGHPWWDALPPREPFRPDHDPPIEEQPHQQIADRFVSEAIGKQRSLGSKYYLIGQFGLAGRPYLCAQCAFVRMPTNNNAKDGGTMEWTFNSLDIDSVLGDGIAVL